MLYGLFLRRSRVLKVIVIKICDKLNERKKTFYYL